MVEGGGGKSLSPLCLVPPWWLSSSYSWITHCKPSLRENNDCATFSLDAFPYLIPLCLLELCKVRDSASDIFVWTPQGPQPHSYEGPHIAIYCPQKFCEMRDFGFVLKMVIIGNAGWLWGRGLQTFMIHLQSTYNSKVSALCVIAQHEMSIKLLLGSL